MAYKDDFKALLQVMLEACRSERGYTTSARVLAIALMTLTNTWVRDYRSVNADEWQSDGKLPFSQQLTCGPSTDAQITEFKRRSHESWGRLYEVKDVKIEWHVSTPAEIDYVLELLRELVVPALERLETLLADAKQTGDLLSFEWISDFCRVG